MWLVRPDGLDGQVRETNVSFNFRKKLVLKAIGARMSLPEAPIDRIMELTHLKQLISLTDINCVLDVGANKGQFASELRGIGFNGLIVSFEFARLQEDFSSDPLWRGFRVALGEKSGIAKINVIPHLTVMSSLLETTGKWRDVVTEDIEVKRLDEIFHTAVRDLASPRVLLKMDTQGYDLNVFAGAQGCIGFVQALQSELSVVPLYKEMPHYLEALAAYERADFLLFNLSVVGRIADGGLQELNCLMKRNKG
jgi:FkbM family methyltransferase